MNKKTVWVAQTGVMLALLIILQFVTRSFGQYVTGSCVNFVLAITAIIVGFSSSIIVAIASPFLAFFIGIGPAFLPLVPCIAAGNAVLVIVLHYFKNKNIFFYYIAAIAKFAALYLLVTKIALPLLGLPAAKAAVITAMFNYPQLITAVIGTTIAFLLKPLLEKALKK